MQEIRPDPQSPGSAEGLGREDSTLRNQRRVRAQQHALHGGVVGRDALDREVAARRRFSRATALGLRHGAQHRNAAVLREVDPDAEVDLL